MTRYAATAVLAAVLALGGCSLFGGGDEEEPAPAEQAAAASYEPVVKVSNIEIGRTRNGLVITATGLAPGLGYSDPELRARRDGRPGPEGYLDFDLVARAPATPPAANNVPERVRLIRADYLLPVQALQGARGIRIHAAEGGMMMNF